VTGWADAGLVALGGVTSLVGGALESGRARRRDDRAHSSAAAEARRQRELDLLTTLHGGLVDIWPGTVVMAHKKQRTLEEMSAFAVEVGRLKVTAQRLQDEELRTSTREWLRSLAPGVLDRSAGASNADDLTDDLASSHTELTERLAIRIRELEAGP
jgi:hypothetical protein